MVSVVHEMFKASSKRRSIRTRFTRAVIFPLPYKCNAIYLFGFRVSSHRCEEKVEPKKRA
jgi:hypothetical protein